MPPFPRLPFRPCPSPGSVPPSDPFDGSPCYRCFEIWSVKLSRGEIRPDFSKIDETVARLSPLYVLRVRKPESRMVIVYLSVYTSKRTVLSFFDPALLSCVLPVPDMLVSNRLDRLFEDLVGFSGKEPPEKFDVSEVLYTYVPTRSVLGSVLTTGESFRKAGVGGPPGRFLAPELQGGLVRPVPGLLGSFVLGLNGTNDKVLI